MMFIVAHITVFKVYKYCISWFNWWYDQLCFPVSEPNTGGR